jgi:hypothetical protein
VRRLLGVLAVSLSLIGVANGAPSVDVAAAGRSLVVDAKVAGIAKESTGKGNAVIVCTARAKGSIVVTTTIQSCTVTSSMGGTLKGVTPVTYAGSNAATAGAGALRGGSHYVCVTARATYAFPSGTLTKTKCVTYV